MSTDLLNRIQDQKIEHVYQPMWNLSNWTVYGYEALLRFSDGFYNENIERAFEIAMIEGLLFDLDTASIEKAVSSFPLHILKEELLFINIFPSTLLNKQFEPFIGRLLKKHPEVKGRIVLELNETKEEEYIWSNPELKNRIAFVRKHGMLVAFDDIGKGGGALKKVIEFTPDYIKLDRYFASGLYESKEKQHMVSLLVQYAKGKMGLILEGIEEEVDLAQAKILNVPIVQGYLLGKPQKMTKHHSTHDFSKRILEHVLDKVLL